MRVLDCIVYLHAYQMIRYLCYDRFIAVSVNVEKHVCKMFFENLKLFIHFIIGSNILEWVLFVIFLKFNGYLFFFKHYVKIFFSSILVQIKQF